MPESREFLLDTHTFLWWITDSPKLSKRARAVMTAPKNRLIFSAVSAWEIAIKASLGKLREAGDPELAVPFHLQRNSIESADFPIQAALRIHHLPPIHADPFDRALVAHSQILEVPILSADPIFKKYPVKSIW